MPTLVNAVNCRGVMGAGLAAEFKRRFPVMFTDYQARCARGEVALGRPYLWRRTPARPASSTSPPRTTGVIPARWRPSTPDSRTCSSTWTAWKLEGLAVPALGCGLGQLDFDAVLTLMQRHLRQLSIPVLIYRPR
jgi:O-acetyl-ADP-ribose deacetylase (regulator of RNase III)